MSQLYFITINQKLIKMLTPQEIQSTAAYKLLSDIRKTFVVKKENRKQIYDGITICRNIGFENWSKSCGYTSWNIAIVKELLNN